MLDLFHMEIGVDSTVHPKYRPNYNDVKRYFLRYLLRVLKILEVAVEAEVLAVCHLGENDDLAGVLGEVLDDVVDGFQDGDVVFLDFYAIGEAFDGEGLENVDGG